MRLRELHRFLERKKCVVIVLQRTLAEAYRSDLGVPNDARDWRIMGVPVATGWQSYVIEDSPYGPLVHML